MPEAEAIPIPQAAPVTADASRHELWSTVLRVAWLSIGLGLVLEILLLVLAAFADTAGDSPKPFLSDLAHKVSWSFIVCVGLAFGTTASKMRAGVMGLLGLISAPLAFTVARFVHKGVNAALGVAGSASGISPFLIGTVKGIEYAVLGAALGWLGRRQAASLGLHLSTGAAIGLTFGTALVALTVRAAAASPPLTDILAKGINEVLFPIGCSLVLYAAGAMSKRLS
jgi:hypothetical protein